MTKVTTSDIKKLRELSGVGVQDAQIALKETDGDIGKAIHLLRKKGAVKAVKKSSRTASQGLIESYVHGGKVGVLVEVNCETDFVAKTDDFKNFVHDLSLQIAASAPVYITKEQVDVSELENEKEIIAEQMKGEKKSAKILETIITGKLEKYYEAVCLMEQPTIKDPKIKVKELLTDLVNKLGENIVIARFIRYQLGEEK